jgi:hypothetical protein
MRPKCHRDGYHGFTNVYRRRIRWDEPSVTITAGCTTLSTVRFGHPEKDRTISLREAAPSDILTNAAYLRTRGGHFSNAGSSKRSSQCRHLPGFAPTRRMVRRDNFRLRLIGSRRRRILFRFHDQVFTKDFGCRRLQFKARHHTPRQVNCDLRARHRYVEKSCLRLKSALLIFTLAW